MKLRKKVSLIAGIVIIAVLIGTLFTIYFQQVTEKRELSDRLTIAQTDLPSLIAEKNGLEDQLAQAESLLNASQAKFPEVLESIEYGEDFFKVAYGQNLYSMASGCGVELTSLTASKPTTKKVGAVTYSVSSFTVVVKGNIDDTLDFIDAIGTGIDYKLTWNFQLPWSVDVKSVSMSPGGATINLDIYGYKG